MPIEPAKKVARKVRVEHWTVSVFSKSGTPKKPWDLTRKGEQLLAVPFEIVTCSATCSKVVKEVPGGPNPRDKWLLPKPPQRPQLRSVQRDPAPSEESCSSALTG